MLATTQPSWLRKFSDLVSTCNYFKLPIIDWPRFGGGRSVVPPMLLRMLPFWLRRVYSTSIADGLNLSSNHFLTAIEMVLNDMMPAVGRSRGSELAIPF